MKREYDFSKARRGPLVAKDPSKTQVTIGLDNEVLDYLESVVDQSGGGSLDSLINEVLLERIEWPKRRALKDETCFSEPTVGPYLSRALEILDRLGVGNPPRPDDRIPRSYLKKTAPRKTNRRAAK